MKREVKNNTSEKTTSRAKNIESANLSYANDFKGYMRAYNHAYNSMEELKNK